MTKRTVRIQKADIALLDGETLDNFSQNLRMALQKSFGKPRKGNTPGIYVWARAIFSDRAVFEKDEEGPQREIGTWSVAYKRQGDGAFEFEQPVRVREQINYVPVTKSDDGPEMVEIDLEKKFWDGLPLK